MGTNDTLLTWIESKPGPFTARTQDAVWDAAWKNFNEGETGGLTNELLFSVQMMQAGFGIRALAVGGYALDKVT